MKFPEKSLKSEFIVALLLSGIFFLADVDAKSAWVDSPLPVEAQKSLEKAGSLMRSGKYNKAKPAILAVLETANDLPKCLAIAQYTEAYAFPMMDVRRQCLNKALSLCQSPDDFILVALKSRKYQFFEITRLAMSTVIKYATTMPALYDLAHKAQEVALSDLAHLAMEKAFTGLKTQPDAFTFADQCKALGMEDLLRNTIKQMIDDEDQSADLCDLALKVDKYNMRDLNRYLLRKALDNCKTVPEMEMIAELGRRMNEPDVTARAQYFVKKGKLLQKIKNDQTLYESNTKAARESADLESARQRDAAASEQAGFGSSNSGSQNSPGNNNSTPGF